MLKGSQTTPDDGAQASRRPIRVLTAACLVTAAVLSMSVWSAYDSHLRFGVASQRSAEIRELRGQILHLDEVLTMSARMATATGEARWEARYRRFEPQLGRAIEAAKALVPDLASTGQTDAANDALVALEERAFELARRGHLAEARVILDGEQYAAHKAVYAEGMELLGGQLAGAAVAAARSQQKRAQLQLVASAVALPLLIAGWWVVLRITGRWRRDLAESHRRLVDLNRNLDQKVVERTAALVRATEAANTANQTKSQFLANMSHELRTPLNAVIGYSEMIAEDLEDEGHGEHIPDLNRINAAGKHLLALINDVLDLSKIESGRMEIHVETFDVGQVLDEAMATVAPLADKQSNHLIGDFAADIGTMRADMTKLRQSLLNLLSNAAKFTENGSITLAARRERRDGGEWLRINVTDTGIGIPPEKLERIFDEFSQADSSITRDYGGTGLGLPISRRFCQMMGGDVHVESEPGRGSTFVIELPVEFSAPEMALSSAVVDRKPEAGAEGGASVSTRVHPALVVDDDEDSRQLLRRTLEADGYSVVTAASGAEALSLARELAPCVITLDVMMPEMDGWAVLRALKSDSALQNIPVVMVTVVSEEGVTGYALGASEYLTKPVDRKQLLRVVQSHAGAAQRGRALIVEDDAPSRLLVRRTLEEAGWEVSEAENGRQGLDRVAERLPDLILLDLMMPVMHGFEFMEHLRELETAREVPVIVLTAKELTPAEEQFLEAHTQNVIRKGPHELQDLLDYVRRSAARNR